MDQSMQDFSDAAYCCTNHALSMPATQKKKENNHIFSPSTVPASASVCSDMDVLFNTLGYG
jgi:hypothetical protein